MSASENPTTVTIVDSVPILLSLLDNLTNLPSYPPSLYIKLEGIYLGRDGSISILSLYLATTKMTYLVDIHVLGRLAFSTINKNGDSLKLILEKPAIPKVFFDIRHDSDALFSNYQISVDGIRDLQLMELATRNFSKQFLAGLAKCIRNCTSIRSAMKAEWQQSKDNGSRLFDPEKGGRHEVLNERPMKQKIVQYCVRDVTLLPHLWKAYSAKLHPEDQAFWRSQVRTATMVRIELSQTKGYDSSSKGMTRGPWNAEQIQQAMDCWNDDALEMAVEGMDLNDDGEWV